MLTDAVTLLRIVLQFVQNFMIIGTVIPAKFHNFSVMLTNLKDSHDLTIVF